jgi:hypothetical protein
MSKLWLSLVLAAVLSACTSAAPYAPWPSGPADVQAKRFETVPDRAVIYVVRVLQDLGNVPATLWLDNQVMGATYMGTYFRWEVPAGQHLIAGYGSDNGMIRLDVQPGRIYYVQQVVRGGARANSPYSTFRILNEADGRALVNRAVLIS